MERIVDSDVWSSSHTSTLFSNFKTVIKTGNDPVGIAYMGGICYPEISTSVVEVPIC